MAPITSSRALEKKTTTQPPVPQKTAQTPDMLKRRRAHDQDAH
jgi:hypothetical protein